MYRQGPAYPMLPKTDALSTTIVKTLFLHLTINGNELFCYLHCIQNVLTCQHFSPLCKLVALHILLHWAEVKQITLRLRLNVALPTEGRVSERGQRFFDKNRHQTRSAAPLKVWKHNRVKRANPALCLSCFYYWEVCTRHGVIFLTLPMKRGLIFTDQLTCKEQVCLGYSFRLFFSFAWALPTWRYCRQIPQIVRISITSGRTYSNVES